MTDPILKEALAEFAGQAAPVPGLAGRVLRRHDRRRRRRITAAALAAVATAAAVVVPFAWPQDEGRTAALHTSNGLPANTPDEVADALRCLRRKVPRDPVAATDARLLARIHLGKDLFVAAVGSPRDLVLCAASPKTGNTEVPQPIPWYPAGPADPKALRHPLRVDAAASVTAPTRSGTVEYRNGRAVHDDLVFLVSGRARPEVRRVEVTWSDGRTVRAVLRDGFFLASHTGRMEPDPTATGAMSRGAMRTSADRPTRIVAYGASGVLYRLAPRIAPRSLYDNSQCVDTISLPRHYLCSV
ncbi:hypothetical protein [Actinomadura macrotermitis]|uniref:Uncharacterized protein n=1 Tax=Actinomadura macrotermitis TaxID=2585200 RepID=A0A7K0C1J2_9ACTN|nr:hypothetical protein [Actinomadura macrotermitis]MQY07226.1 hypothetical protein [Actinomadura macrotermitis]